MAAEHLEPRLARRLAGQCLRCREPAVEGSDWCAPHGDIERSQGAVRQANRRAKLRAEKRCLDCGCSVRSVGLVRCAPCRKANLENRPSVTDDGASVTEDSADPAPRGHWKLEHGSSESIARGWEKTARYVGRARRGAPSKEDRDRDLAMDAKTARERLSVFEAALEKLREFEASGPIRSQRDEARIVTADSAGQAARLAAALYAAIHPDGAAQCCVCGHARAVDDEE